MKKFNCTIGEYLKKSWDDQQTKITELEQKLEERKLEELEKVKVWAQAVLTAMNVGNVERESALHLKLREVMIAYRASQETRGDE